MHASFVMDFAGRQTRIFGKYAAPAGSMMKVDVRQI